MSTMLKPPSSVLGMKTLDRNAFVKQIQVFYLKTSSSNMRGGKVLSTIKKYLLKAPKAKPISSSQEEDGQTEILLNPDKFSSWDSFASQDAVMLEANGISPASLFQKTIELKYENFDSHDVIEAAVGDCAPNVTSFSRVGHIIHLNLREEHLPFKQLIAQVLLDKHGGIRTILNKTTTIENEFRNLSSEVLAGDADFITTVREHGCTFHLDYSQVYWNPRLQSEHERLVLSLPESGAVLYDIFAGIGPFAIPAAKRRCVVLANDLNPASFQWLEKNIKANKKVKGQITPFNLDGREFIRTVVREDLRSRISGGEIESETFMVMNLPASAEEFLNEFQGLLHGIELRSSFKLPTVHLYCFERDENMDDLKERVEKNLGVPLDWATVEHHVVRNVSPSKDMVRLTFQLPRELLLAVPSTKNVADSDALALDFGEQTDQQSKRQRV